VTSSTNMIFVKKTILKIKIMQDLAILANNLYTAPMEHILSYLLHLQINHTSYPINYITKILFFYYMTINISFYLIG